MVGLILVCLCIVLTKGANIQFTLRGEIIPNHGLISFEDIVVDRNGNDLQGGLSCMLTSCCLDGQMSDNCPCPTATSSWHWHYSNGRVVPDIPSNFFTAFSFNDDSAVRRVGSAVILFRRQIYAPPGIWRCQIPDETVEIQNKYIGIYLRDSGGAVTTSQNYVQHSVTSEVQMFTLTLSTTGGPASSVAWTRDGVDITTLSDMKYSKAQQVRDTTNAEYANTLTVNERLSGVYEITVNNSRLQTPIVRRTTIILDPSPTNLTIIRTGLTSIRVSWNPPGETALLNGYSLSATYVTCPNNGLSQCMNRTATETINPNTLQATLNYPDVPLWSSYIFTIDSVYTVTTIPSEQGFFGARIPLTDTYILTGVLPPSIVSTQPQPDATSAIVTWTYPNDGLSVDDYMISYRRTNGVGGECSDVQSKGIVTTNENDNSAIIRGLQEFSVYTITITARNDMYNEQNSSMAVDVTTLSAAPSRPPRNLLIVSTTNMTTTSITITWESVECIHRNGLITHYLVRYGTNINHTATSIPNDGSGSGTFTVTVNTCEPVSYFFEVAAVNSVGMGPSAVVQTSTNLNSNQSSGIDYRTAFYGVLIALILVVVIQVFTVILFGITLRRHCLCQCNVPDQSTTSLMLGANKAERDIKLSENYAYECTQQGGNDTAYEDYSIYEQV